MGCLCTVNSTYYSYLTHNLKYTLGATTVVSQRGSQSATKTGIINKGGNMQVNRFLNRFWLLIAAFLMMLPESGEAQVALAKKNVDTARIEQIDHKARIFVESARPLASAALELANKYGWQINYEDPYFLDTQDLQDVTAFVSRIPNPEKRVLFPRGGTLEQIGSDLNYCYLVDWR